MRIKKISKITNYKKKVLLEHFVHQTVALVLGISCVNKNILLLISIADCLFYQVLN